MATYTIKRTLFAITLSVIAVGCVREADQQLLEQDPENLREVVFHAGWATETKTVLQEDGSVWWSAGDEIGLCFPLKEKNIDPIVAPCLKLVFKTDDDAPLADYYVDMDNPISRGNYYEYCRKRDQGLVADTVYAIYPERSDNSNDIFFTSEGNLLVYFTIPTVQIATPESFDKLAMVSIAESDGNNLGFRNLCGGIKFSVSQPGIKEVSFRSSSGETLSGSFFFIRKSGELFVDWPSSWGSSGSDEVIVRAPDDSYFEVGKYYYAVLNPLEDDSPIVVTYKKDSSKASYFTSGSTSIKRSVFKRLYDKDAGLTFIPFKDEAFLMQPLPDYVRYSDKIHELTEAHFHPLSDHITEVNLGTEDGPIYFELVGTTVHYYTPKESFNLRKLGAFPMFRGWSSLAEVDLMGVDVSEVTDFSYFFAETALKSIDLSNFDTSSATHMNCMFQGCKYLESLDLTSFNTEHVINMYQMFAGCNSLKDLNLSSFNTSRCINMGGMFCECGSLQKLDLANFNVSSVKEVSYMCDLLATHRKHCVIRANEATKELMCSSEATMPMPSLMYYIKWIAPEEAFPTMEDPFADLYKSSDYSRDKTYTQIQTATKGRGLDIVMMGDAYSDRLINDGTYDRDLGNAIEQIFSEEPLKSLRDFFNVYIVYAVSENETHTGINVFDVAFERWAESMTMNGPTIDDYIEVALPNHLQFGNDRPYPYTIIIQNAHTHNGVCRYWECGGDVVVSALGEDDTDFHYIICHEFGHSIGRLADEYYGGATFSSDQSFINRCSEGWWPNVDITSDPNSVKWSRFLQDGRYANQGLGVFEGGFADYAYGIWRPTENSIMGNALTGFNAPCREAIYKRVHELADDSFVYDYEQFVAFDQQGASQNQSSAEKRVTSVEIQRGKPLPPPIFVTGASNPNGASLTVTGHAPDGKERISVIMNKNSER